MSEHRYRAAERDLFADAGIEPVERWLTLPSGPRVRVLEHGTGTPALFLHGGPNAAATWAYVAAATTGTRCLLLDRPGCGLSEPPVATPDSSTLAEYVSTLSVEVLDSLDVAEALLVGSSFGGYSALRTALAHPSRVTGLVLAGCPAFVPGWTAPSFFSLLRTPLLGRLLLAAPATRASVRMSLRQMGHGATLAEGRLCDAMADWMLAWQRDTRTMANDAAMIVACGTRRGGFDADLDLTAAELGRITAPVSLCFGADDPVGGRAVGEALASALARASLDVLPGAGHLPWLDDPRRLADAIGRTVRSTA